MKNFTLLSIIATFLSMSPLMAQEEIQWMTWEEAIQKNGQEQRVIFVDVYTNWCGWCKKMDATTFKNPEVVKYMNEHYYAVKFNAETRDSIQFDNRVWVNESTGKRGPHQLAVAFLDGRMSYPSYAFVGQPFNKQVVPGYMGAKDFNCVLRYFVEGVQAGMQYEDFRANGCTVATPSAP